MKFSKIKQFDVFDVDGSYYICLGLSENSVYKSFQFIEGEITQAYEFMKCKLKDFIFASYAYELYLSETFKDYIYYALNPTFTYYVTDKLNFSKAIDRRDCTELEIDYRAKKVKVDKEEIRTWYLKNKFFGLEDFLTINDLMKAAWNQNIISEYKWKREDLIKAQKYYMRPLLDYYISKYASDVFMYTDDKYLYYTYGKERLYHYRVKRDIEPLIKVRNYFQVYNFGLAHTGKILDIKYLKPVHNFLEL